MWEGGSGLEIRSFERLPSTQRYLLEALRQNVLKPPVAVIAYEQTNGMGSRDNKWEGGKGNFFASFALEKAALPDDLPIASASIYVSMTMKRALSDLGETVWVKWPNDLYKSHEKIGGVVTTLRNETLVFGIGVNLKKTQNGYASLESDISPDELLGAFISRLEKGVAWKRLFREYRVEFELSKSRTVHIDGARVSLRDAVLCDDGSILINGRKVYSAR